METVRFFQSLQIHWRLLFFNNVLPHLRFLYNSGAQESAIILHVLEVQRNMVENQSVFRKYGFQLTREEFAEILSYLMFGCSYSRTSALSPRIYTFQPPIPPHSFDAFKHIFIHLHVACHKFRAYIDCTCGKRIRPHVSYYNWHKFRTQSEGAQHFFKATKKSQIMDHPYLILNFEIFQNVCFELNILLQAPAACKTHIRSP